MCEEQRMHKICLGPWMFVPKILYRAPHCYSCTGIALRQASTWMKPLAVCDWEGTMV